MQDFFKKFQRSAKTYLNTNILFMSFVLSSVINAWLLRVFTVGNYFELKPILADFAVCLIVGAFGYLLKPQNQFKYFFSWSIFFTTLCVINSIYYTNYISFASISLLSTTLQLFDVADAVVESILEIKDFIFLWQPIALLYVNYNLKKKNYFEMVSKIEVGKIRALNTLVAAFVFIGFFVSMLTGLDIGRFGKQWNREYVVMKFGLYTYQVNDLISSIKPQLNPLFGYDENAKIFREYYDSKEDTTKKNKYSDIFKGQNIIMIHAESIQQMVIDLKFNNRELTPNLNKLSKEGLAFSNFYAQEGVGTSSDSEFTLNTSLMPTSSGTVFVNYWNREYVTIPKMLKNLGYYSFSMHGNKGAYWNRNVVHKEFGYDRFYYYDKDFDLDEKIGLGLSDKSFFRQAVPKIQGISENNQNFYGTMIMLSNHTPFSDIIKQGIVDFEVDFKYEKINEETNKKEIVSARYLENTKIGNYFKSVHYADEAIGQFIDELDETGLLENTVIVIYGDHDAKLKKSEYERFYNYDPYTDSLLDEEDPDYRAIDAYDIEINKKVPFIIWSKNKKLATEVTEVMGMYDIAPTLGNMFGFKIPYALGNDMFSITNNVVVFPDGNWITNKMYYNNQKSEGKLINANEPVSLEEIAMYTEKSEEILKVSNSIIVYDLIRKTEETNKLMEGVNN
ncbi:MAG: LTA synthase family protein [Bacilli bacterium]|nr:LTA synthase family protein [Bacilli bacterium]MDD4282338.1 LTA synthase family protein [Bacilli bacterium]